MFERFTQTIWGSFSKDELKKFFGLALAGFFLIGAQWPAKLLKDSLLVSIMGAEYQPNLKLLSILVCFPITILYTILVEYFKREKIIYIIAGTYSIFGIILAALLKMWSVGGMGHVALLASAFYLFADSLTAISIPSFWSFVNDVTNPEEAKRGYGIIVFFAQLGGLVFTIAAKYVPVLMNYFLPNEVSADFESATPLITLMTVLPLVLYLFSVWKTVSVVKESSLVGYTAKNDPDKKAHSKLDKFSISSFIKGFFTIASTPYVTGIFMVTAFYEIINSLMSYSLLCSIGHIFSSKIAVNDFMFDYGIWVQIVAVIFSLVGTSWFQRNIGVRGCLIGFPFFLLGIAVTVMYSPSVYLVAVAVALGKGLHYALNKPVREILYIPTSTDIKYRSKAWIEVFGSRAAKTFGSAISKASQTVPNLLGVSFVLIPVVWLGVAKALGDKYHSSVANKEKIS